MRQRNQRIGIVNIDVIVDIVIGEQCHTQFDFLQTLILVSEIDNNRSRYGHFIASHEIAGYRVHLWRGLITSPGVMYGSVQSCR